MREISTDKIIERVVRRAREMKISPRRVSLDAGFGPDLIRDWKRPKAPLPRLDSIARVADALNVSPGWLAFGEGERQDALKESLRKVPVISWIAAGRFAESVTGELIDEGDAIDVSGLGRGRYFGLKVKGDSMNRIAPEGAIIIVNSSDRVLVPRKFFVFMNGEGTTFKRYMENPDRLEPFSFNTDHEALAITEHTSVLGRAVKVLADFDI